MNTVVATVTAHAKRSGVDGEPRIRVAGDNQQVYIDLGDAERRAVRATAGAWEIVSHPVNGPYLHRPDKLGALPVPEGGGTIDDLWRFVNVANAEDRMLTLVYLAACLMPHGPYPGLALSGEQDTGKTTTMRMIKALIDPTRASGETHAAADLRPPPKDLRDLTAAVRHDRVLAFDNMSSIDAELSDQLCRLVTGTELAARGLFTNHDEVGFAAARPVMLNGIPDVATRDDLADRFIKITASRPTIRLGEERLWREFRAEWPKLLGVLLDILSAALRHLDSVPEVTDPRVRMADFARLGEAVGRELGWPPGTFIEVYAKNRSQAAADLVAVDPITEPLLAVLSAAPDGEWAGRLQELLRRLEQEAPLHRSNDWPGTARALSERLKRLAPALRRTGITIEKLGAGPRYRITLRDPLAVAEKLAA